MLGLMIDLEDAEILIKEIKMSNVPDDTKLEKLKDQLEEMLEEQKQKEVENQENV